MSNVFKKLSTLNVNDKTEKKGQFTYLSWSWAWNVFVESYPEATYEIVKNENNLPYFQSEAGGMVYTKVTAGGITHEMWLPIMDFKNQAKKQFDMMDVNKTVMRCLVKNLSMFGLGLYIYAGEDLPEEEKITSQQISMLSQLISDTEVEITKFLNAYNIKTLSDMYASQFQHALSALQTKAKKLKEKKDATQNTTN